MNYFFLILLAVAPTIALAAFILLHDRYDKEPFSLLIKVFFFGMLCTIPTMLVEIGLLRFNFFGGIVGAAIQAFIIVGFTEEFFKRMVVRRRALYHFAFNEKLDGIVYCSIASLGFATVENVFYVLTYYSHEPTIWITRAFLSVPTHMLLGIIMGYFLSEFKYCGDPTRAPQLYRRALYVPALLHGAFDFILMAGFSFYIYLLIPLVVFLWVFGMILLRKYYKESKAQHGY